MAILEAAAALAQRELGRWEKLPNTFICRADVRADGSGFYANAVRCPGVQARGQSKDEAVSRLLDAYRAVIEAAHGSVPLVPLENVSELGDVQYAAVVANIPQICDIDAAFDEVLSDDEIAGLVAQRNSGSARPTVPLVRYARP